MGADVDAQITAAFSVPPLIMGSGGVRKHPVLVAYEQGWFGDPGSWAATFAARRSLALYETGQEKVRADG